MYIHVFSYIVNIHTIVCIKTICTHVHNVLITMVDYMVGEQHDFLRNIVTKSLYRTGYCHREHENTISNHYYQPGLLTISPALKGSGLTEGKSLIELTQ